MDRQKLKQRIVRWRGLVAIAIGTACLIIAANAIGIFQLLEWAAIDQWFHLRPTEPVDARIVIVTIDEPDIERIGQWPMSDRTMAQLLDRIKAQQPKAIALDIYRDLPVGPGHPELVKMFQSTPNLVGIEKVSGQTVAPPPTLEESGQVAAVDFVLDADGKLRRALLGIGRKDGEFREGLGVKIALMYLEAKGISLETVDEDQSIYRLGKARFFPLMGNEGGYVGRDGGGYQILLNFRGQIDRFLQIPLTDVLENRIEPGLMRDRLVLIGATTPSLKDVFQTPYSNSLFYAPELTPGIVIHANLTSQILSAALEGRPLLRPWGRTANLLWIVVWSGIGVAGSESLLQTQIFRRNRFLLSTLSYIILASGLLFGGSYLAFLSGWVVPVFSPFLALTASAILTTNYRNQWQLKTANERLKQANDRLEEYSRTLELKVAERTQKLSQTLEHLQATQNELIQKEKMAALGQLVAGVAHEVNSPLGAIRSSIGNIANFLNENLEQLPAFFQNLSPEQQKDFFSLLHKSAQNPSVILSSRELRQIRRRFTKQLEAEGIAHAALLADTLVEIGVVDELEFFLPLLAAPDSENILETVYRWVSVRKSARTIADATERAAKVVFALKTYARYDHSGEKIKANIVEGVETILALYHNQLKQGIEVWRNYENGLPAILCYPDELNQVWTNLIHNAFHAMGNQGRLDIDIRQIEDCIQVDITDSGQGIPEDIRDKIFLPFFTTKPPGEGSGLGLDIVKKIVEKHQGGIAFESVPGQTTFSVRLPMNT